MTGAYLDPLLFIAFPYVALVIFIVESVRRYCFQPFTYSSLSSQFLENQFQFWGAVPFHYGIGIVLTMHFAAFAVPGTVLLWNATPLRLYLLEATGFIFALLALVGLVNLIARRLTQSSVRAVTSNADWALLGLLLTQILLGVYIAIFRPWGTSWFAASLAPYLWSIFKLAPDLAYVSPMPVEVKLHIAGAFLIIAVAPFTRLVHALVPPLPYLWRKPQVVRWRGERSPS